MRWERREKRYGGTGGEERRNIPVCVHVHVRVCVTFYIKESALQLSATAIVCTFHSFEINFTFSNSVAIIGAIVYLYL